MEHGKCHRNHCTCSHGVAATGPLCLQHRLEVCATCKVGYHTVTGNDENTGRLTVSCVENKCTCENGAAAVSVSTPACHTNNKEICTMCDDGYDMGTDHICRMKNCQCDHGFGTRFTECEVHGSQNCKECSPGYHLTTQDVVLRNTQRCRLSSQTQAPFDCDAGYDKRHTGWSLLKKDWCCRNKGVACMASEVSGNLACSKHFNEMECKMIGCCKYEHGRCHSAVGDKACFKVRTLKLSGSPGFCLFPNEDLTAGTVVCNEHNLHGTSMQFWTYDKSTKQIQSSGLVGKCLEADTHAAKGPASGPSGEGPWYEVKLAPCASAHSKNAAQRWTFTKKTRFTVNMNGKSLCLGVRAGYVGSIGSAVVVRKCEDEEDDGQDWQVPEDLIVSA